jgi:glycosyltransferase involved in cell wall biosynthesis
MSLHFPYFRRGLLTFNFFLFKRYRAHVIQIKKGLNLDKINMFSYKSKKLFIIHEYGAKNHYLAAVKAAKGKQFTKVEYIEFSFFFLIAQSINKKSLRLFLKALIDQIKLIIFFIYPNLLHNQYIVIGIAPLDWRIIFFNRLLSKAVVIYHSSWPNWTGEKYPKSNNKYTSRFINHSWSFFLNSLVSSFALVTPSVARSLIDNWRIDEKRISIVKHSFSANAFFDENLRHEKYIKAIFVGRLTFEKGIYEVLELATKLPMIKFTILGQGNLETEVIQRTKKLSNLEFRKFTTDKALIRKMYSESDFILLPSKRTSKWEELFGIVLIEAMACGCIPITTNHEGPVQILRNSDLQQFIFNENDYVNSAVRLLKRISKNEILDVSLNSKNIASQYNCLNIKKKWEVFF